MGYTTFSDTPISWQTLAYENLSFRRVSEHMGRLYWLFRGPDVSDLDPKKVVTGLDLQGEKCQTLAGVGNCPILGILDITL